MVLHGDADYPIAIDGLHRADVRRASVSGAFGQMNGASTTLISLGTICTRQLYQRPSVLGLFKQFHRSQDSRLLSVAITRRPQCSSHKVWCN